ncbi:MAG: hemerythrin domain-containing protein [Deltaproteobacteria bacterium]|nr:hemerythrin domain-containing protein [Deltaproteobacteria bacterium]
MDTGSDTQSPATPDEIKARIRSEHAQISALLARVEVLSERVGDDDAKSVVALRDELLALGEVLLDHLHYEEYQLPSLAEEGKVDEMMEGMRREHQAQRDIFDSVIRELDETAVGSKLLTGVRELSRAIRDDMEHEERELLSKP